MNDLTRFNFNGWDVRAVVIENDPWFVAVDVCNVLGLGNPTEAVRPLDFDEKSTLRISEGGPEANIVNEAGLYTFIIRSNKSEAKAFRKWITHDVLPSIRKHGIYATPATIEAMLADPDTMIKTLQVLKEERALRQQAEQQLQIAAPKVEFYDTVTASGDTKSMDEVAKIIGIPGWGRNTIFALLREINMLRENNQPYQGYIDRGYFELIEQTPWKDREGHIHVPTKTVVTQKGIEHIARIVREAAASKRRTLN
jgi:anti-repressor protein